MDSSRADLDSLYPFLSGSAGDLDAVLGEVAQSTKDKAREVSA